MKVASHHRGAKARSVRAAPTILVGLTIPLAACAGSDTDVETSVDTTSSPNAAIAAAAQETLDAGTAKVAITVVHTSDDALWGIEAGEREGTQEGAVDFENERVALGRAHTKTVIDGTTVYFKDENEPDGLWRKYDLDDPPKGEVSLFVVRRYDPVHILRLVASLGEFELVPEVVAEERIRGKNTTHYRGSVENEALARTLTPGFTYMELIESRAYPQPLSTYATLESWVGDDGRLYRVLYDYEPYDSFFGERTIVELYDFGADVAVAVPSPDETVDG